MCAHDRLYCHTPVHDKVFAAVCAEQFVEMEAVEAPILNAAAIAEPQPEEVGEERANGKRGVLASLRNPRMSFFGGGRSAEPKAGTPKE